MSSFYDSWFCFSLTGSCTDSKHHRHRNSLSVSSHYMPGNRPRTSHIRNRDFKLSEPCEESPVSPILYKKIKGLKTLPEEMNLLTVKLQFKQRPLNSGTFHITAICAVPGEVWQLYLKEKRRAVVAGGPTVKARFCPLYKQLVELGLNKGDGRGPQG